MANGDVLNPVTPTGEFDYDAYRQKISQTAAQTRDTGTTSAPSGAKQAVSGLTGSYKGVGEAAITNYEQQALAQKKQSEKAATALEMQGGATIDYLQRLDTIKAGVKEKAQESRESWNAAAEKADEYVQAAKGRVGEVLSKLDEIHAQIGKDRDFAKAHAMQASAQAVLGSMKTEERNILENYGSGSKEYEQFRMSKQNALATVQSNIHSTYQQLREEQDKNYLNVVSDSYTKSNMYLGFQEQQHVEMLKYKADAQNAYDLQVAQFEVGVEQLRMQGLENLANWVVETPTFSMDATPLMTLLSDLSQAQSAEQMAMDEMRNEGVTKGLPRRNVAGAGTVVW